MSDTKEDEVLDITDKNFQKIAENFEKSGFREGTSDGRDSIFQNSFDNGYEDGFRIGFLLGKSNKEKSSRGKCRICIDPTLRGKPEKENGNN
ncbi:CLUMA_CG002211, isoform A, partial [Clunio marinus]